MLIPFPIMVELPAELKNVLAEAQEKLKTIYGKKLDGIIVFGSYARGDSTEGSDVDLALLLNEMESISSEREKYFADISDICLKYDQVISVIPFDSTEFQRKKTPLILNIQREGIRV